MIKIEKELIGDIIFYLENQCDILSNAASPWNQICGSHKLDDSCKKDCELYKLVQTLKQEIKNDC